MSGPQRAVGSSEQAPVPATTILRGYGPAAPGQVRLGALLPPVSVLVPQDRDGLLRRCGLDRLRSLSASRASGVQQDPGDTVPVACLHVLHGRVEVVLQLAEMTAHCLKPQ
jgi:hypothetical protein